MSATALMIALASAALMGLAIQRGATCMVAAVDEVVRERRAGRALALAEAALWVGGLIAAAQLAGLMTLSPNAYAVSAGTVLGGMLLGIGAWLNQACVFGAIARIGSGQWAWLATPIGFFLGCLLPIARPEVSGHSSWIAQMGPILAVFAVFAIWRLLEAARAPDVLTHLWHPHRATLLIAITFVSTLLTVGLWAYTDALAAIARAMDARIGLRGAMVLALLGGAILGGWFAGKLRWQAPRPTTVIRCLAGGALMGAGAMLVPGSNDGLILIGLPLLQPHAWLAIAIMIATIAVAIALPRRFRASRAA